MSQVPNCTHLGGERQRGVKVSRVSTVIVQTATKPVITATRPEWDATPSQGQSPGACRRHPFHTPGWRETKCHIDSVYNLE